MRSIYIHIPFCKSICSYCDFCKFIYNEEWAQEYLSILKSEIYEYYEGDTIKSIYIGGGTPSSLSISDIKYLFKIISVFKTIDDFEFTFECNINDINEELLTLLKENGVNRISIGIESFDKINLKFLNRKHDKKMIKNNIKLTKKYFDNINVDLIYALPTETMHIFKSDVKSIIDLDVPHISTYSLIIEEHTVLYNNKIKNIDEDDDYKMYKYICKKLKQKGYNHYEVSNFAKEGYESRHNLTYWCNQEYYGFGLGAHGYINKLRYENTRNFGKYLREEFKLNELLVSTMEEMENEIILGLRKLEGINVIDFKNKYGTDINEVFPKIQKVIDMKKGLLDYKIVDDNHKYLFIPEKKIYVMNEIINMIL
jgi:oxygen-independent coproporphyrinogen-3 oxidase